LSIACDKPALKITIFDDNVWRNHTFTTPIKSVNSSICYKVRDRYTFNGNIHDGLCHVI